MPLLVAIVVVAVWALLHRRSAQNYSFSGTPASPASPAQPPQPVGDPLAQSAGGQLDNLTQAIANLEGFGIPGARPTRDNNPGDLKYAPGMTGRDAPGSAGIAQFADEGDGWDALSNYVTQHVAAHPDWDFYDFTHYYATGDTQAYPAAGEANPDDSADKIAAYLGVDPTTLLSTVIGSS